MLEAVEYLKDDCLRCQEPGLLYWNTKRHYLAYSVWNDMYYAPCLLPSIIVSVKIPKKLTPKTYQ